MNLNPQQEEAAKAPKRPLLIVAGAGTGKTTTLANRLIHLIEGGIPAHKICAITFTNKAAKEMADRVAMAYSKLQITNGSHGKRFAKNYLPEARGHLPSFIGTFHGLGVNILRQEYKHVGRGPYFVIFDDHDSFDLIKKILKKEKLKGGEYPEVLEKGKPSSAKASEDKPGFFANKISEIKNKELHLPELKNSEKQRDRLILKIYSAYEARLEENNAFDFDDLIEKPVSLFKKYPEVLKKHQERFEAILVDEYQDLNPKQYELVKFLAGVHRNLSVVGDDEQMIYGWRHANLKIFLGFEKDWPDAQIKFLEENYRSTANIIEAAGSVASHNNYRRPKNLWTKNPKGELIKIFAAADEDEAAEWICLQIAKGKGQIVAANSKSQIANRTAKNGHLSFDGEIRTVEPPVASSHLPSTAVLYRTNAQSRAVEEALIKNRIPYRIFGGLRFYERKEIKDIVAALRYATNKDEISLDRLQKNLSQKKFIAFEEKVKLVKDKNLTATKWIEVFLQATDYLDYLEKNFANYKDKQENIAELVGFSTRFADLPKFLEEVALIQPMDGMANSKSQIANSKTANSHLPFAVNLMTVHIAKGLEFDRVFITGCSEGLLPHAMSMENEYQIEEERRLMYVAMTRAKRELFICFYDMPSRFISEIPEKLIEFENLSLSQFEDDVKEIYLE